MVPNLLVYRLLMLHSFCVLELRAPIPDKHTNHSLSIWCRLEWQMMANWMVLIWTYMQIVVPAPMILMWVMLKHWLTMVTSNLLYTFWRTGVFFAWACATAEQAMCMEAHHRVCLHQNGASQSYHSDYFARWSWRMCPWFNKMCSLQKKLLHGLNKSEVDRL